MNRHLETAAELAAQLDAILYAIDEMYMDAADEKHQYLHNTMLALTAKLIEELDLLAGDRKVVDAIYAVNDARRSTLKAED